MSRQQHSGWIALTMLTAVMVGLACMPGVPLLPALLNNTASLGGDTPGDRGQLQVSFINNTPYRAVFTAGTYDPMNLNFTPRFEQFLAEPETDQNSLDAFSESEVFTFAQCGRAMAIGQEELAKSVEQNDNSAANIEDAAVLRPVTDPRTGLLRAGVKFVEETAPTAQVAWSPGIRTLHGSEYLCDSLLIYSFQPDDTQAGGVRIDLTVIPQ